MPAPVLTRRFFIFLCLLLLLPAVVACQEGLLLDPTSTAPPPTQPPTPTLPPTPDPYSGIGFDAFLAQVEGALLRDRPGLINPYLAQLPSAPLVDGERVIFIYQGSNARTVQVAGDMSGWDPAGGPQLRQIEGTDLWVGEASYEIDARLDYKFVINGQNWILDPLNPRTVPGGFGPNSELAMPGYVEPAEIQPATTPVPAGTLTEHTLDSTFLEQTRTFYVYSPASTLVGAKLPTVVIHDGGEYISLIEAPAILDRLIAAGEIPPLVTVFVPPVSRNIEYDRNDAYVQFLADELIPFIQAQYDTDPDPTKTGNIGASLGGLLAVYAALTRPDVFGLAGGYSGAYSLGRDAVVEQVLRGEVRPVRFYLVVGTYETAVSRNEQEGNLLAANQRFVQALEMRSYGYKYVETPQGHSWGLWRDYLGDGLRFLYGE